MLILSDRRAGFCQYMVILLVEGIATRESTAGKLRLAGGELVAGGFTSLGGETVTGGFTLTSLGGETVTGGFTLTSLGGETVTGGFTLTSLGGETVTGGFTSPVPTEEGVAPPLEQAGRIKTAVKRQTNGRNLGLDLGNPLISPPNISHTSYAG